MESKFADISDELWDRVQWLLPRRLRPGAGHMGVQQRDDARVVQPASDDVHGDLDCSPDRSGDADEQPKPSPRHL